ncbi:TfoX/Sxy family protein [Bacteroidota bacterium]
MNELTNLPNIGKTLAKKLIQAGINSPDELKNIGAENAIIRLKTIDNAGVCINMLYALEGAIQNIRWHGLSQNRKNELNEFYNLIKKE